MPSGWMIYPDPEKDPDARYKFTSLSLYVNPDMQVTERRAYSLLEWLGDVGGLLEALRNIGTFLITPITAYLMRVTLLADNFRYIKQRKRDNCNAFPRNQLHESHSSPSRSSLTKPAFDLKPSPHKIKRKSLLWYLTNCRKRAKYKKLLDSAEDSLKKELDLRKFLPKFSLLSKSLLSLLNWRHKQILASMNHKYCLKEHIDQDSDWLEGNKSQIILAHKDLATLKIAHKSTDPVERRLKTIERL